MQYMVKWLDLEEPSELDWGRITARQANRGHSKNKSVEGCSGDAKPQMHPETRTLLEEFYRPWNAMLAAQLGPHMTWNYVV